MAGFGWEAVRWLSGRWLTAFPTPITLNAMCVCMDGRRKKRHAVYSPTNTDRQSKAPRLAATNRNLLTIVLCVRNLGICRGECWLQADSWEASIGSFTWQSVAPPLLRSQLVLLICELISLISLLIRSALDAPLMAGSYAEQKWIAAGKAWIWSLYLEEFIELRYSIINYK